MLNYNSNPKENFKCRICAARFKNPDQLRKHRMDAHKTHLLTYKI